MIDHRTSFRYCALMMCPRDYGELKPNFYHSCAEKIFPAHGIATRFVPNLRGALGFRVLRLLGVGERHALALATITWIFRHRKSFDIVIGWHGSAMLLAVLRAILGWKHLKLCLILYRLYNPDTSAPVALLKRGFLRIVSRGADFILSVDWGQAVSFAKVLRRERTTTLPFRYGVDYGWFADFSRKFSIGPRRNRIFCPGSAYRDDVTLRRAVSDLEIEVWRTRLGTETNAQREMVDRATFINACNMPYNDYVSACLESSVVVISAHSSDKPVGLTSLLECMALGRPVIITRGLSSYDYVIDNVTAIEFDEGDSQALKDGIRRLLDDPGLAGRLTQAANASLVHEFDLSKTGPEFARLIIAMISSPSLSETVVQNPIAGNVSR